MRYRASAAGFEFSIGSPLRAILPASFQAAVVGSLLILAYLAVVFAIELFEPTVMAAAGGIMFVFLVMFLGTLIGTVFCAFYIAVIGAPLAMLLGERIERPVGLAIALVAALLAGGLAAAILTGSGFDLGQIESWYGIAATLAYAIPAGLLYRRSVVVARELSRRD
ncbi:hypothetical protein [Erythrobacter sp. JK5]|uniref:hypothetical protein n=1 Tax=Erythrobacter sp. JK5 TaxID=2829500 RepID=UPI001BAB258E|nr:hypothetical protein [Erythrobacter sp. JK5]QUL37758.1 hypothetical protein KDC96_15695 [Erythrobacter sp. JK5]